jgi:hypothetical protein
MGATRDQAQQCPWILIEGPLLCQSLEDEELVNGSRVTGASIEGPPTSMLHGQRCRTNKIGRPWMMVPLSFSRDFFDVA